MAIIINIDVMLARRKMSVTELTEKVGITMANISILKNGKAKAVRLSTSISIVRKLIPPNMAATASSSRYKRRCQSMIMSYFQRPLGTFVGSVCLPFR